MRLTYFAKIHTVAYSSKVDLLAVACEYLVELLGCTSWPQLLAVHENVLYTVISFARSLLATTRDYPEGPTANSNNSGTAENEKEYKHMQMFYVTKT